MKKNKRKKGFTLVELLVVIAIIGILAVVALPSLFKNIEKAKIVDLESDINTIRSAVQSAYAQTGEFTNTSWTKQEDGNVIANSGFGEDAVSEEIDTLSIPFGGSYSIIPDKGSSQVNGISFANVILWIMPSEEISEDGLKKLERDLGQSLIEYPGFDLSEMVGIRIFKASM